MRKWKLKIAPILLPSVSALSMLKMDACWFSSSLPGLKTICGGLTFASGAIVTLWTLFVGRIGFIVAFDTAGGLPKIAGSTANRVNGQKR